MSVIDAAFLIERICGPHCEESCRLCHQPYHTYYAIPVIKILTNY